MYILYLILYGYKIAAVIYFKLTDQINVGKKNLSEPFRTRNLSIKGAPSSLSKAIYFQLSKYLPTL